MEQGINSKQLLAEKALENLRMRLLDLTARNRLINFRHSKNASLRIIDELPNQLVETLLAEREMRFEAIPEPTEEELIRSGYLKFDEETNQIVKLRNDPTAEEWAKKLGFATSFEVPEVSADDDSSKHSDTGIQTLLYPFEMEATLKNLLQAAESAIQEMGANILYLAFGFLEWYEANNSESVRVAPLFLVPVRLHKGRLNPVTRAYEYTLSYSGEDIIPNLSLREKLRADFAMALPELDEHTVPEDYFSQVRAVIKDKQPRWHVRRQITLALLNFSKLLMYLDLDPARWPKNANIVDHPVVSRFLSGFGEETNIPDQSAGDLGFGEEYIIDDMDKVHANYPLIDDADSSQHSALIDAVDGKNLVIEGPPGTGKSQTITNLIAAAMAQGKKVLFVAEKLAALEVVRSRLDKAGLGEFCLELHSHKSQKLKVLDEVSVRLKKHGCYRKPKDIEVDIARYEEIKTVLKNHAEQINQPWKRTGKTLHEIFMAATRYRNSIGINPESLHPDGYDGNNYDATAQRRNKDQVELYSKVYQAVVSQLDGDAALQDHSWYGVRNGDLQIFDLDRVKKSLGAWQELLHQLRSQRGTFADTLGCDESTVAETLAEALTFLEELESVPKLKGDEILEALPVLRGDILEKTQRYLKLFEDIQEQYALIAKNTGAEILQGLSIADQLSSGGEQLKKLVGGDVTLGGLSEAIRSLSGIKHQLELLDEPFQGVATGLGDTASKHFAASESGLIEFKMVIELIVSLNPSYWKHRDELFDNEELDKLLPQLRTELEELQGIYNVVHGVFYLERIPDENEIRRLANVLASGGVFRWFKSGWRAARKQLLSYAANAQVRYAHMVPLLSNLEVLARRRRKLDSNIRYKEALSDYFLGLDTDLVALEELRAWYKRIRQQYGIGFGQKVSLGSAILELSPNIAKAVRSLAEHGLETQLSDLLDELGRLKKVFSPVATLQNEQTLLTGEDGTISHLLGTINQAIQDCGALASDDSLTISGLTLLIDQIGLLKQRVETWQKADFDRKLFQARLGLKVGLGADNTSGIAMLRNTLQLAQRIDGQLRNQALVSHIYTNPTHTTFSLLVSHAEQLRAILLSVQASFEDFSTLVQLNREDWLLYSGDHLDDLVDRNQLALDNGEMLQNCLIMYGYEISLKNWGLVSSQLQ